ncbi:ATP-binding cassette domain-containing protein [Actinoplanes sp. NPDC051861]|uniref:ABC transporter ATP-binding protein n=1 Tax=Actinoplanes sp. NPDC051861 TaxID=3155170 RepID=UPI0034284C4D
MLHAEDLSLSYGATVALAGASATVARGEIVALVGQSGSGKTSMLYCMAGLLRPSAGRVRYGENDVTSMKPEELAALRRARFGFVFQSAELVPELSLRENISLPLELLRVPARDRRRRVDELIERLGLTGQAARRPALVSGGQAQRAAVARAIAHRPEVVFADEPTGSVDSANGTAILDAFVTLARENGTAVALVTHDPGIAARADRVVELRDGRNAGAAR